MTTSKVNRDKSTYHLVQEEKIKLAIVSQILTSLRAKKTHKYRPTSISNLAVKVAEISENFDYEGETCPIGKSTLLREKGKYRPLLEAFFAGKSGGDSLKQNLSTASIEDLKLMVRDQHFDISKLKKEKSILERRIEKLPSGIFDALPSSTENETNEKLRQKQSTHNICTVIFSIMSYLDEIDINPFEIRSGELIDPMSGNTSVVKANYFATYIEWLEERTKQQGYCYDGQ